MPAAQQDVADARAVVLALHAAAYDKTLNRRAYVLARDSIEQRSKVLSESQLCCLLAG